jgi:hypothetical protein
VSCWIRSFSSWSESDPRSGKVSMVKTCPLLARGHLGERRA